MIRLAAALSLVAALTSCGVVRGIGDRLPSAGNLRGELAEVEGVRFRSRLATTTEDRRGFVATTRDAQRNVVAALEAARMRAVGHCLHRFGTSQIAWALPPDRDTAAALAPDGSVQVQGTCTAK